MSAMMGDDGLNENPYRRFQRSEIPQFGEPARLRHGLPSAFPWNSIRIGGWNKKMPRGESFMKCMTSALVAAAALLTSGNFAAAQKPGSIHINVNAELRVDCNRPLHVNNFKVRIDARNTIAADKSAFATWQITSLGTETLSFSTKLGSAQSIGLPSGSSAQLRVTPGNGLLLTMTSPQSTLSARVTASGSACNVTLGTALRGGFREYSLWSGSSYYYCSQPRVVTATCRIS
jgi:hypothetical protein